MQSYNRVLAIAVLAVASLACRDSATPNAVAPPSLGTADARRSMSPRREPKRVTPAEFHAQNKMDWVGVEHNRLMDELRAEVRSKRPKDMCKTIERLGIESDLDRRATDRLSSASVRNVRRAAFEAAGCKGQRFGARHAATLTDRASSQLHVTSAAFGAENFDMSPAAWAFVDRITMAGGDAPEPSSLASELASIVADAHVLTADEQTVIDAAASVALASFEYWAQNSEAMVQEMSAAYGRCVENGGGESCFYAVSGRPVPRTSPRMVHLATNSRAAAACAIDKGFIWSGDKWGVGVGLATGLMTRSVQGVIVGIIAGAAIGSGGAATWEFGKYVWCAFT